MSLPLARAGSIVTLPLTPAVDLATEVDRLEPTHKLRCNAPRRDPGGGGINVARAIRRLGGDALAIYLAGGPMGEVLDTLIAFEGVRQRCVRIANETRESISVTERATGAQYRFVLPGPEVATWEANAALTALVDASQGGYVIASGSLPQGLSDDFYRRVADLAVKNDARFVLDASGSALQCALGPNIFLLKPSRRELSEIDGRALSSVDDCLAAARRQIAAKRTTLVAVSLGEEGALLVGEGLALKANAPCVTPISSVGAGDSFLGALVLALSRGATFSDALRRAVAGGTASLLMPGTGLCQLEDVERLLPEVRVEQL